MPTGKGKIAYIAPTVPIDSDRTYNLNMKVP